MAQLIATRDMTVAGRKIPAGHPIPAESLRSLPQHRIKQMQDQRMVHEDHARVSSRKER